MARCLMTWIYFSLAAEDNLTLGCAIETDVQHCKPCDVPDHSGCSAELKSEISECAIDLPVIACSAAKRQEPSCKPGALTLISCLPARCKEIRITEAWALTIVSLSLLWRFPLSIYKCSSVTWVHSSFLHNTEMAGSVILLFNLKHPHKKGQFICQGPLHSNV